MRAHYGLGDGGHSHGHLEFEAMGSASDVRRQARAEIDQTAMQQSPSHHPIRSPIHWPRGPSPAPTSPTLSACSTGSHSSSVHPFSLSTDDTSAEGLRQYALQHSRSFPTMSLAASNAQLLAFPHALAGGEVSSSSSSSAAAAAAVGAGGWARAGSDQHQHQHQHQHQQHQHQHRSVGFRAELGQQLLLPLSDRSSEGPTSMRGTPSSLQQHLQSMDGMNSVDGMRGGGGGAGYGDGGAGGEGGGMMGAGRGAGALK